MKKTVFYKLLTAMGITLSACLLLYPLLLPTENYFRLVLQLLPVAVVIGLLLVIPMYMISDRFSRGIAEEFKKLKMDSKSSLTAFPELRPVVRQISSFRVQMESRRNELEGQQEQLRVLTDNMQEGLLLVSAAGRVLSCNRAALNLLSRDDSGSDFSVFDLNDSKTFHDVVESALEGVRGSAVITVNGTAFQLFANPVAKESTVTGAVLVLLDVTEREQRDTQRRKYASRISDELKTPLTAIHGIADMMQTGKMQEQDIPEYAGRIRDESSRMITLIEDILSLSRLDDDSFSEAVVPVDLYEIAEGVRKKLTDAAAGREITLTMEGESAPMQGAPEIVENMLCNLCDNAIKYNKDGGEVHMKVTCTEQSAIFTVTDHGIGIPLADRERIFERFYQVDRSHSKQIGGTGLGLSIVKQGAAFHNAKIELQSKLGEGTTVTLFFPRSAETAALAERDARNNPLDVDVPGAENAGVIQVLNRGEASEKQSSASEPEIRYAERPKKAKRTGKPKTKQPTIIAESNPDKKPETESQTNRAEISQAIAAESTKELTENTAAESKAETIESAVTVPAAATEEAQSEIHIEEATAETDNPKLPEPDTEQAMAEETAAKPPKSADAEPIKLTRKKKKTARPAPKEEPAPHAMSLLDEATRALEEELESELASIGLTETVTEVIEPEPEPTVYVTEVSETAPLPEPEPELPPVKSEEELMDELRRAATKIIPDMVPISEDTMDIKI